MTEILIIMITGITAGIILKKRKTLIASAEKLTMWAIYLLLFLLGLSVGTNEQVIKNFGVIGFQSVILTISGIAGSIILAFILYIIMFKDKED
ncbi:MAG TPA: LysO family transporter [Spirochaetota bacterium]|nr:LysO family transporter [Spirochaetota bacterium]HPJ33239.1 LysO family transporter [Spirochaetota bacterium]